MVVTKLEKLDKGKVKVYIDGEYHFLLYNKDIETNHICEDMSIPEELYNDIVINTVLRRAKQKALAILKHMDRTEHELIMKLKQADYADEIINETINYVKSYHYLDDERYARNYIEYKKLGKSKRQIEMDLLKKGISKKYIELGFEEQYNGEEDAIKKAIEKKLRNNDNPTREEMLKLAKYLYQKGYNMDLIRKFISYCLILYIIYK